MNSLSNKAIYQTSKQKKKNTPPVVLRIAWDRQFNPFDPFALARPINPLGQTVRSSRSPISDRLDPIGVMLGDVRVVISVVMSR